MHCLVSLRSFETKTPRSRSEETQAKFAQTKGRTRIMKAKMENTAFIRLRFKSQVCDQSTSLSRSDWKEESFKEVEIILTSSAYLITVE